MTAFTFKKATSADAQLLADYRIEFALEYSGAQPAEAVEALRNQMTTYFAKANEEGACVSFIAMAGDEVAGIGTVHFRDLPGNFKNPSGKWGYIMNMFTVKQFRGQGICRRILALLIEEGEKRGVTAFELYATPKGEPIYLNSGFHLHSEPTLRKFI